MKKQQDILEYCLEYWNDNFCGISSHQVSRDLDIEHEKVRRVFRQLKKENQGTLNDDVLIAADENDEKSNEEDQQMEVTIFFPSRETLKDYYKSSGLAEQEIPEYKKKLHLGHNRTELFYFPVEVLDKYINNTDKYNVYDTFCGGFLSEKSEDTYTFRYGKRKINQDERVVAVVLDDLAELAASEQQHWNSREIETPEFTIDDPDFHEYYLRYYEITPVDSYDPLHDLIATLKKINSLSHVGKLFKNIDSTSLKYPVKNTYKSFYKSCKELSKIIAPNSINKKTLKRFLTKNFQGYDKLTKKESDCDADDLFANFLKEIHFIDSNSIDKLTGKDERPDKISNGDYLDKFKKLCKNLLLWHRILHRKLKESKPANLKKYIRPSHLEKKNKDKHLSLQ